MGYSRYNWNQSIFNEIYFDTLLIPSDLFIPKHLNTICRMYFKYISDTFKKYFLKVGLLLAATYILSMKDFFGVFIGFRFSLLPKNGFSYIFVNGCKSAFLVSFHQMYLTKLREIDVFRLGYQLYGNTMYYEHKNSTQRYVIIALSRNWAKSCTWNKC